jgi:hypothetical protein
MYSRSTTEGSMVTLYFTRRFTKGNLVGLHHNDKITFASYESAKVWLNGINKHSKRNGYEVVDASFQNYVR